MQTLFINAQVYVAPTPLAPARFTSGGLLIEGNTIAHTFAGDAFNKRVDKVVDLQGSYLAPGFFDIQVNGGGGVLFNDSPTPEGIRSIARAHLAYGTTSMLPTLISDDLSVVESGIQSVEKVMSGHSENGIQGIHIEGPFLNVNKRGVHAAEKIKRLANVDVDTLCHLEGGKTLVTLAPECVDTRAITALTQAGVVVSVGHSAATYEEINAALSAGASCFTHLFNAMTPMTSRAPGVVGAALEDKQSWCGIIADGHHVDPAVLTVAVRAKQKGKMILVSDAMPSVGAKSKTFPLNGEQITAIDGRCATALNVLAGSDLDMIQAVKNTMDWVGVDLAEAVSMASLYPAQLMGLDDKIGKLQAGWSADLLVIDKNRALTQVWQQGKRQR